MQISELKMPGSILCIVVLTLCGCSNSDSNPAADRRGWWTVSGKCYLVSSKVPLAGVLVTCAGTTSTSGVDGSFEIKGVPDGNQTLSAVKAGTVGYSASIEVSSHVTYYIYLNIENANLSGYVSNAVDGPILGARVVLHGLVDYTDISGRYDFSEVPRGNDTLFVTQPAYNPYKIPVALSAPNMQVDVQLSKDTIVQGKIIAAVYVFENDPNQAFPNSPPLYGRLLLVSNGHDSLGLYHGNQERRILVGFEFPQLLKDRNVLLVEGTLQLSTDTAYSSFPIETYSVGSLWDNSVTYNTQPSIGTLLFSGSIGGSSSGNYWTVLGTNGLTKMLTDYRVTGVNYGIVIRSGTTYIRSFYSNRAITNRPTITFHLHY